MIYSIRTNDSKQNLGASHCIKLKARELRANMTDTEKILWNSLRKRQLNGFYFRRQHPYNIYILDFFCFEANLAIEVDGKIHLKRRNYDKQRTDFIKSSGLKVLRFNNEEIEEKLHWVIDTIKKQLPPTRPSPKGAGDLNSFSPLGETGKGVNNLC